VNVPRNESSMGTKILSVDFSFPGSKVQRNEKSVIHRYRKLVKKCHCVETDFGKRPLPSLSSRLPSSSQSVTHASSSSHSDTLINFSNRDRYVYFAAIFVCIAFLLLYFFGMHGVHCMCI